MYESGFDYDFAMENPETGEIAKVFGYYGAFAVVKINGSAKHFSLGYFAVDYLSKKGFI